MKNAKPLSPGMLFINDMVQKTINYIHKIYSYMVQKKTFLSPLLSSLLAITPFGKELLEREYNVYYFPIININHRRVAGLKAVGEKQLIPKIRGFIEKSIMKPILIRVCRKDPLQKLQKICEIDEYGNIITYARISNESHDVFPIEIQKKWVRMDEIPKYTLSILFDSLPLILKKYKNIPISTKNVITFITTQRFGKYKYRNILHKKFYTTFISAIKERNIKTLFIDIGAGKLDVVRDLKAKSRLIKYPSVLEYKKRNNSLKISYSITTFSENRLVNHKLVHTHEITSEILLAILLSRYLAIKRYFENRINLLLKDNLISEFNKFALKAFDLLEIPKDLYVEEVITPAFYLHAMDIAAILSIKSKEDLLDLIKNLENAINEFWINLDLEKEYNLIRLIDELTNEIVEIIGKNRLYISQKIAFDMLISIIFMKTEKIIIDYLRRGDVFELKQIII